MTPSCLYLNRGEVVQKHAPKMIMDSTGEIKIEQKKNPAAFYKVKKPLPRVVGAFKCSLEFGD